MFWRFALCLGPALIAAIMSVLMSFNVINIEHHGEIAVPIAVILVLIGSLITSICVARLVWRAVSEPTWAKWLASILTFVAVGITYLGISGFGGCLLIAANA